MEAVRKVVAPRSRAGELLDRERSVAARRGAISCSRRRGPRRGQAVPAQPAPGSARGLRQEKQQPHGRVRIERNRPKHRRKPAERRRTRGGHRPRQRHACRSRLRASRRAGPEGRRDERKNTSTGRRSPRQGHCRDNRQRFDKSRDQPARQRSRKRATSGRPARAPGQLASAYHHQSSARRIGLRAGGGQTFQHQPQFSAAALSLFRPGAAADLVCFRAAADSPVGTRRNGRGGG